MVLLVKMLCKKKILVLITVCTGILTSVLTLWWNAYLGEIIDIIGEGTSLSADKLLKAFIVLLLIGASAYAKGIVSGYTCESMAHDLRMGYARHIVSLPVMEVEEKSVGEQLSRLQNEIADVSAYLNSNLFLLWDDIVRFLISFIWLLAVNPILTISINLPVLFIMFYVVWTSRIISSATKRSQQSKSMMNEYADILLSIFSVIRLYDAGKTILGGYGLALKEWEHQTVHAERVRARLLSLSALLSAIPLILLFWIGGDMVIGGNITMGIFYIFLNPSGNMTGVLMNMPGHIAAFRQFSVNMSRMSPNVTFDKDDN